MWYDVNEVYTWEPKRGLILIGHKFQQYSVLFHTYMNLWLLTICHNSLCTTVTSQIWKLSPRIHYRSIPSNTLKLIYQNLLEISRHFPLQWPSSSQEIQKQNLHKLNKKKKKQVLITRQDFLLSLQLDKERLYIGKTFAMQ